MDLLTHALRELELSKQHGDPETALLARRQAAEKAWGHMLQRIDELLQVKSKDDLAHDERQEWLAKLEESSRAPLVSDYFRLQTSLHGNCFYRGSCPIGTVERDVRMAAEFPDRVERALRASARRRRR